MGSCDYAYDRRTQRLADIVASVDEKSTSNVGEKTPFAEITDDDIDNLFSL